MEIEQRMGLRVRSNYEDVAAFIRSGGGSSVPYPNRKELEMMDSHVYAQLTALLSAQETQSIVDEYRRDGGGPGGRPGAPPKGFDVEKNQPYFPENPKIKIS